LSTAMQRSVWHVICSAVGIELAARVPYRFCRELVQELPPAREKSARDTAG
jgi:hypothetical protein